MVTINYRDGRPIYEQVKDDLRRLVVTGAMRPGEKLPSVRELAVSLAINPNTIQRAYGELEKRGVIYSVKGRGNFVSHDGSLVRLRRLEEIQKQMAELAETARELGANDEQLCAWVRGKGENA